MNLSNYFEDMTYSILQEKIQKDKLLFKNTFIPPSDYNMPQKEIIDGYMVKVIEHYRKEPSIKKVDTITSNYKIKLIYKEDKIVFYELYKINSIKKADKWTDMDSLISSQKNNRLYNELLKKYNKTYALELNSDELFDTNYIYGKSCSISGVNPKYRTEMNQIISTQNKDKLMAWLKSPIVELQLYAIEAIYKLEKKNVDIPQNVYDFIKIVEKKNGYVNTCNGCYYEYKSVVDVLNELKTKHNKNYN